MIAAYLKVVKFDHVRKMSNFEVTYLLSINPYLGPLQIALGKMIIDIVKWMFLFLLVVFAFGCGMTQLLWYYADLEMQVCYRSKLQNNHKKTIPGTFKKANLSPSLPGGLPNDEEEEACTQWRRFANLWETSQVKAVHLNL